MDSTAVSIIPKVIQDAVTAKGLNSANLNILLPTQSFGDVLGQYDKISIEVIKIDPSKEAGEVFEPGGEGKGFAFTKIPLEKIANALAIQWDPRTTTILESTSTKARAKATGAMRKPNGEYIIATEEKTVDIEAIEEEQRIKIEDDAKRGKIVEVNGQIQWAKTESGKSYPKREQFKDEADKAAWIDREVRKALVSYRKFKDERAMTGAKERVIKFFLALKSTYTKAELEKPFAFPRVTLDVARMLESPETRAAAIERLAGSVVSVFGPGVSGEIKNVTPERKALTADSGSSESEEPEVGGDGQQPSSGAQASAEEDTDHLFEPEDEEPPDTESGEAKVKRIREQLYLSLDSPAFKKEKAQEGRAWLANNPEAKDLAKLEEKMAKVNKVIERWKAKVGAGKGAA